MVLHLVVVAVVVAVVVVAAAAAAPTVAAVVEEVVDVVVGVGNVVDTSMKKSAHPSQSIYPLVQLQLQLLLQPLQICMSLGLESFHIQVKKKRSLQMRLEKK